MSKNKDNKPVKIDFKGVKEKEIKELIYKNRRAMFNLACQKKVSGTIADIHEPKRLRREIARAKTEMSMRSVKSKEGADAA